MYWRLLTITFIHLINPPPKKKHTNGNYTRIELDTYNISILAILIDSKLLFNTNQPDVTVWRKRSFVNWCIKEDMEALLLQDAFVGESLTNGMNQDKMCTMKIDIG